MGSRGGDKITNKHQPKVTISLSRDEVKLHESENAWKPARFNKGTPLAKPTLWLVNMKFSYSFSQSQAESVRLNYTGWFNIFRFSRRERVWGGEKDGNVVQKSASRSQQIDAAKVRNVGESGATTTNRHQGTSTGRYRSGVREGDRRTEFLGRLRDDVQRNPKYAGN